MLDHIKSNLGSNDFLREMFEISSGLLVLGYYKHNENIFVYTYSSISVICTIISLISVLFVMVA